MARTFNGNSANFMSRASVNLGLNGASAYSHAVWVRRAAVTATTTIPMVKRYGAGSNSYVMTLTGASFDQVFCAPNDAVLGQNPQWLTTTSVPLGVWTRVLFTFQRNAATSADGIVYFNGVAQGTTFTANGYAGTFTISEDTNLYYIGIAEDGAFGPVNGDLAWATVWNRALTAQEALLDLVNPWAVRNGVIHRVGIGPGLDNDDSGFGNHMTVTGTLAPMFDPMAGKIVTMDRRSFPRPRLRG